MTKRSDRTAPPATAWIVINGRANRECPLLDVGPAGAKIVVQDRLGIPERFELALFRGARQAAQMRGHLAARQDAGDQIRLVGVLAIRSATRTSLFKGGGRRSAP